MTMTTTNEEPAMCFKTDAVFQKTTRLDPQYDFDVNGTSATAIRGTVLAYVRAHNDRSDSIRARSR